MYTLHVNVRLYTLTDTDGGKRAQCAQAAARRRINRQWSIAGARRLSPCSCRPREEVGVGVLSSVSGIRTLCREAVTGQCRSGTRGGRRQL